MPIKFPKSGQRLVAMLVLLSTATLPAIAASEDDTQLARRYLRCAAFYLFGTSGVSKPELKQQLQQMANISLYSAEVLMDKDRLRVKSEFDSAREKFLAETLSDEVKADARGFLQYMGEHCNELRKNHRVPLPKPAS
ncbi:hypothetical protein [Noviherbaspirillum sedimenti]|uniref:Uncharacterized protein n=1 Tax=Noviherbaspirillum sedimenti TaxID=2320865 RepID=A0A3A3G0E1_9BURK|nr:hypothetical protein [Noviherbaspirillum sedimenti]RJG01903.1 hypothetical protein D3878_10200 [Noviherbaspirillum sedimenti]